MSNEENNTDKKIKVSIDTKRTEELARENERLLIEKKQREEDPERFKKHFDLADEKLKAYKQTGEHRYLECNTKEEMVELTTALMKETVEKRRGTPSGTSFPNEPHNTENLFTRKFLDSQEMVSELRRLSKEGTPQERADSEHYLDELWRKYVLDKRAMPTRSEVSHNPNSPESLLELGLKQKDGFLTPADKEDGDLGKLQKKWRDEKLRKMRSTALEGGQP
jgi:hypothetical protein